MGKTWSKRKKKMKATRERKAQRLLKKLEGKRKKEQLSREEGSKKKTQNNQPAVPFPQRLQKSKIEEQFARFLKTFQNMEISMPFTEVVTQMPLYAKFLKYILSKKRKIAEDGIVNLTATFSVVIKRGLPEKMKDLGSFTIPCTIGEFEFQKALCDSGASINLMPYSVAKKLSLGEITPTTVTLQMADRTLEKPEGIIEDVLVKVGKFIFPADFIILDMEEDSQVPLLLGRPFLATGGALIDMQKGILTLRVGEETADFNLIRSLRNLDIERDDIKSVEDVYVNNSDLYYDCNDQLSINEKEMNFQYLEGLDSDSLHINLHSTEKVMNLEQNGIKQRKKN